MLVEKEFSVTIWILLLAALVPFWLLQNIIHELAHGLTMRLGWAWRFRIWPFPSMKLGRFTFAHVVYEPSAASGTPTNKGWALVSIMPKLVNVAFMILGTVLSIVLRPVSMATAGLLVLFAVCNAVDFSVGMTRIFCRNPDEADIWKFQSYMEMDVYRLRWLSASIVVAAVGVVATATILFILGI